MRKINFQLEGRTMGKMIFSARSLFVAGTGTDVGKTVVSSLLLGSLRQQGVNAVYQKWVSTGGELSADLGYCLTNNAMEGQEDQIVYQFRMPASPHLAAEQEGREVEVASIIEAFHRLALKNEMVLVEGVGGVLVPLRRDLLLADLLAELHLPVLLVASSGLGTINHSLLSIEALRARGIDLLGMVFSDERRMSAEDEPLVRDNMRTVGELGRVEVCGRLPRCSDVARLTGLFAPIGERIIEKLVSGARASS